MNVLPSWNPMPHENVYVFNSTNHSKHLNSFSPTDAIWRHGLTGVYMFLNSRRYAIVNDFCLFKLFLIGWKELKEQKSVLMPNITPAHIDMQTSSLV